MSQLNVPKVVDETAGSLQSIAGDIEEVKKQIRQIAGSFEETRQSIGDISTSTTQLDETAQRNTAMLEEANAALQALDEEAMFLKSEVATFRLTSPSQQPAAEEKSAA